MVGVLLSFLDGLIQLGVQLGLELLNRGSQMVLASVQEIFKQHKPKSILADGSSDQGMLISQVGIPQAPSSQKASAIYALAKRHASSYNEELCAPNPVGGRK